MRNDRRVTSAYPKLVCYSFGAVTNSGVKIDEDLEYHIFTSVRENDLLDAWLDAGASVGRRVASPFTVLKFIFHAPFSFMEPVTRSKRAVGYCSIGALLSRRGNNNKLLDKWLGQGCEA